MAIDRRYGAAEGLAVKMPVRVATTANITLTGTGLVIDPISDTNTVIKAFRCKFDGQTDDVSGGSVVAYTPTTP